MPSHWKWLSLILAYMAQVARADPWDDFANNSFTDLAPLLALFGERATMQFMSQSLGWEDCVILAMAPLGIITILVSAIRVGGPAWLKAVVGRARENMPAAEMELMSSTSKEVCELYNGQTIVRCQGSTPVWEFIYLIPTGTRNQDLNKKLDIKVVDLEEACKGDKKLLRKLEGNPLQGEAPPSQDPSPPNTSKMAKILHKVFASSPPSRTRNDSIERGVDQETRSEQSPNEAIYVIRNMNSDAPSIILNLQSNNANNRRELKSYAMIGVFLQLCVLVFFGIITYHPNIRDSFQKDDQRVDDYAFPLAISGTLVLAIGVFLCGTVVESCTQETHYKKNEGYEMQVVWIQQKQTVGDQVFEPFATFPDTPRDIVTMSRRCHTSQTRVLEPLTIIGICTGLAGFIIQFIGLRGMNSAATLAQLGVVGIMTAIRAWVRRGLAVPPRREKLTSGFELDTLAWALALLNHSRSERLGPETSPASTPRNDSNQRDTRQQAEKSSQDLEQTGSMEKFMNLENQKRCSWSLSTGGHVDHQPFLKTRSSSHSRAQQVFETRWNLSRLAQFKGASATEAINLATAMEKVMSVLFPLGSEDPEMAWTWPLTIIYGDSKLAESRCHVNISVTGKGGAWKILADQLESVLSLCLFTIQKEENIQSKGGQAEFNLNNENEDWLRQETVNSGFGIRILGATNADKTDQLIQDLRWWAPEIFEALGGIQEVVEFYSQDNAEAVRDEDTPVTIWPIYAGKEMRKELDQILKRNPKWDAIHVDNYRVVGYGPSSAQSRSESQKQRFFRNFSTLTSAEREKRQRGTLVIESNDSLEKLFAKDLLFSFLLSAAKTLPTVLRAEAATRETTASSSIIDTSKALAIKEVTSLVAEFGRLGYGTEQEAWLSIIAPLSMTEKLPVPRPLLDLARERAESSRLNHRWMEVNRVYLRLWEQTQRSRSLGKTREWGNVFLVEYLGDLRDDAERAEVEGDTSGSSNREMAIVDIKRALRLSKHQPNFFKHLLRLYERQGRSTKAGYIQKLASLTSQDNSTPQGSFPDSFAISELHSKAMNPDEEGFRVRGEAAWNAINERDICGWTPLHYAIISRNQVAVEALVERGADFNLKSLNGFTPVHCLSQIVSRWEPSWKLDAPSLDGSTPMHIAAHSGNAEFIKSWAYEMSKRFWVWNQASESASNLRDYNGRLPIHRAVICGHQEVVQILKNTIDEPDMHGWTSLHLAVLYHESGSAMMQTVLKLSDEREKADKEGRTPLVLAIDHSKWEAAHDLIEAGVDVNSKAHTGSTTLQYAINLLGDAAFIQALVSRGAKVHVANKSDGLTPLHSAAARGSRTIMEIILGALDSLDLEVRAAAIHSKSNDGQSALHVAASLKRPETAKLLLSAGADPNSEDNKRRTPLHQCLRTESSHINKNTCLETVKLLIDHDADPRARDSLGKTPLDLAVEGGQTDAAEYLRGILKAGEAVNT